MTPGWPPRQAGSSSTYTTPAQHNNPMEPHAALAPGEDGALTIYDSSQGPSAERDALAEVFGLEPEQVRVISAHVGGGFGSKGSTRPHVVVAALAARAPGSPVKVALTRQQMFAITGYRTPTIQRLRLGAAPDGPLTALDPRRHRADLDRTEFAEQTAVCSRVHVRAASGAPPIVWPRSTCRRRPGCARRASRPGMYALESAIDELAVACGIDPIELRISNEPERDPESGYPWSSRNLVACLREGAERFGWRTATRGPGIRRDGGWLIGTGVAAATFPAFRRPSRRDRAAPTRRTLHRADRGRRHRHRRAHGAHPDRRADALERRIERVQVEIGDSALPLRVARGRLGGYRLVGLGRRRLRKLRERCGRRESAPGRGHARTRPRRSQADSDLSRHAFGAQFAEVRVDATPARCACRGCSACSRPDGSSTQTPPARSSSGA